MSDLTPAQLSGSILEQAVNEECDRLLAQLGDLLGIQRRQLTLAEESLRSQIEAMRSHLLRRVREEKT